MRGAKQLLDGGDKEESKNEAELNQLKQVTGKLTVENKTLINTKTYNTTSLSYTLMLLILYSFIFPTTCFRGLVFPPPPSAFP